MFDEKCGCGRPVRYSVSADMSEPGSCNKRGRCPTYEELKEGLRKANHRLFAFQYAVNKIDDVNVQHHRPTKLMEKI